MVSIKYEFKKKISGIEYVIHVQMPLQLHSFLQMTGAVFGPDNTDKTYI